MSCRPQSRSCDDQSTSRNGDARNISSVVRVSPILRRLLGTGDVRYGAHNGLKADIAPCPFGAIDRDRGEPLGSAPPTPPYVRVRIRRFERFRLTRFDQGQETERFEVGIGKSHGERFTPGDMPGATDAAGHVAQLSRDSECDECCSATPWCFPLAPKSGPQS